MAQRLLKTDARRRLRTGLACAAALAGVLGVAACGDDGDNSGASSSGGGGGEKVTLTLATYGGVYEQALRKAWLEPYMKAHPNVTIRTDGPTDYGKIKAMVQAGNVTWDLVDVGGDFGLSRQTDILAPIDCKVVACDGALPGLENSPTRVAFNSTTTALAYNEDSTKGKVPAGWSALLDTTGFPGKRTFPKWAGSGVLEAALLADGVPKDQLYPLDVDRAFRALDKIKKDIVWWTTPTESEQLLGSGEVTMGAVWAARAYDLVTRLRKPVGMVWNDHLMMGSYLVFPKGGKSEAAQDLAAYITDPANNGQLSFEYPVGPAVKGAKTNPETDEWLPSGHLDQAVPVNDKWWDENLDEVDAKFQEWLKSS